MSQGGIHEISEAIGALRASMGDMVREQARMNDRMDGMGRCLTKFAGVAEDVAEMKPVVEDYKKTKNRAMGVLAFVALLGGGASQVLPKAWEKFLSIFH